MPRIPASDVLSGKDYIRNEPQQFAGGGLAGLARFLRTEMKNPRRQLRRLDQLASEVPDIEKMYGGDALKNAFSTLQPTSRFGIIDPRRFDNLSYPLEFTDPGDIKELAAVLQKNPYDEMPYLGLSPPRWNDPKVAARIVGHDGRHRSRALAELGYEKSPIVLQDNQVVNEERIKGGIDSWLQPGKSLIPEGAERAPIPWEEIFQGKPFAGGGLAQYIRHRLMQEAKNAQYGGMRQKLQGWAQEEISDPFDVSASGRKALALGPDKVVKLVGRYPRGIAEQGWEGEGPLQKEGVIPQLHFRSPENELAVVERIPHTKESAQNRYMGPLEQMFDDAHMDLRREHGANWYKYGHQVPIIAEEMRKRGLAPFLNYPQIASADFFHPGHWGFRQPYKGPSVSRGVLLDPGAMEPNLVEKSLENKYSPQMRSIAAARAKWLQQHGKLSAAEVERKITTDPGSLINDFSDDLPALERHTRVPLTGDEQRSLPLRTPDPEQLNLGLDQAGYPKVPFAGGGPVSLKLAQALMMMKGRQAPLNPDELPDWQGYAPGGVVRNWLRGVPGSAIDEVLKGLKSRYHIGTEDTRAAAALRGQPNVDENLKKNTALHQWIDRNLGNYIVRQLGTEDDPLAQAMGHQGGDWGGNPRLIRRIPAAQVPERLHWTPQTEVQKEFEGNLHQDRPSWLQKLIEEDTPRNQKAAEILKAKAKALDEAPYGGGGRKAVDEASRDYTNAFMGGSRAGMFEGLPDPIMLHDLDPAAWRQHMQGPMQGVMDYLSQNYTPEQLNKVSVPDAWRGSATWHEALAKKKAEIMKDPFAGTAVHKEYPSGYKWVKFDPGLSNRTDRFMAQNAEEGKRFAQEANENATARQVLEEALKKEGDAMGHCVGGYCDDVMSGQSHIYSLRDAQGQPHVTVEVNPGAEEEDMVHHPSISQIKGKGNKKPADQYLPYVQDFVRSGKWGDVGDLQNTGLVPFRVGKEPTVYYGTDKEMAPHMPAGNRGERFGYGTPLQLSDDDLQGWRPGSIPGMAEGGEVELEHADHEDALLYLQELLGDHAQA